MRLPDAREEGYTWRDLVCHAIAVNSDRAAILAEAHAEYFRYKSRTDWQDPRLTFDYTTRDSGSNGQSRDKAGGDIRLYTPNPFVDKHVLRAGEAARRETEAGASALTRQIAQAVYQLVQEALSEERTLAILRARETVLADWAAHLKERQEAHVATPADVLALDLQRLRLKAAIQQARLASQAAHKSLQVLTQIPEAQLRLDPAPTDWTALLATLADEDALLAGALTRSPEIAAARAAHDKARATLDTAKARQIPWFAYVQAGYGTRSDGESSSGGNADDFKLGLAINIPVFAWMSSEKEAAAAAMDAAIFRQEGIRQRIRNDITRNLADLRETLALLSDYRAALDAIPEPGRDAIPDAETFYKLSDTRLSAAEHALRTELRCALIYGQILNATSWQN